MRPHPDQSVSPWLIVVLILAIGALAFVVASNPGDLLPSGGLDVSGTPPSTANDLLQSFPGLVEPPFVAASEAGLRDDDPVIGVVVNGIARAYPARAMNQPQQHVINDRIGTTPVSVTYCNMDGCARAFTKEGAAEPLDLAVGGQHHARGLILLADGARYYQSSQEPYAPGSANARFPYSDVPATVTTWKAWRTGHPDTQVSRPAAASPVWPSPRRGPRP